MAILVAYASGYGATRRIGERVAEALRAGGLDAEALPEGRGRPGPATTSV